MEPKKIILEEKLVSGISVKTSNQAETNTETAKISGLWNDFIGKNIFEKISFKTENAKILAVYSDYESDHNGRYTLLVGTEVIKPEEDNFAFCKIEKGEYLSFHIKGQFPGAIMEGWKKVWEYFETNKEIQRLYTSDFEEYLSEDEMNINIAVKTNQ